MFYIGFRCGFRCGIGISFELNTMLIKYDGLGSLCYTTDLLKNGCLPCISPSNDQYAKMRTIISILEHCNGFSIYIHCQMSYLAGLGTVL